MLFLWNHEKIQKTFCTVFELNFKGQTEKRKFICGLSVENCTTKLIFLYKSLWPNIYEYVNKLGMFEQKLATGKYCNVEFIVPTKSLTSQPQHFFRSAIQGAHWLQVVGSIAYWLKVSALLCGKIGTKIILKSVGLLKFNVVFEETLSRNVFLDALICYGCIPT